MVDQKLSGEKLQDMIIKSYGYGRKARVRRRERIHPKHPMLPMRSIDAETDAHRQDDADNSSDEEKRLKVLTFLFIICITLRSHLEYFVSLKANMLIVSNVRSAWRIHGHAVFQHNRKFQ